MEDEGAEIDRGLDRADPGIPGRALAAGQGQGQADLGPEPVGIQPAHPSRRAGREDRLGRPRHPPAARGAGRHHHHRRRRHDLQRADQPPGRARPPQPLPPDAGGRHRLRQPRVLDQRPPGAAAAILQLRRAARVRLGGGRHRHQPGEHDQQPHLRLRAGGAQGLPARPRPLRHHPRRRRPHPGRGPRARHHEGAEPEDALRPALLPARLDARATAAPTRPCPAWPPSTRR